MITGGYEGNIKATIIAVIVFHMLLYILARKQVKLLIQAFKNNTFNETYELLNTKHMVFIISLILLMTINLVKY